MIFYLPYVMLFAVMLGASVQAAWVSELFEAVRIRCAPLYRRRWLSVWIAVALPLLLRLLFLSRWPVPVPLIHDEFSYLYAADTFAAGRLVNPPHLLWRFFETVYIIPFPVGASKYPPAQGLILAAGQILLGHPWFGVWLSCGMLTGAVYWMLLSWTTRGWAFAGAFWVGLYLGFFTDWMNSYWGGSLAAAAGAILIGCLGRLYRRPTAGAAAGFALAWTVLANTRPYEGAVLLGIPAAILLLWHGIPRRTGVVVLVWGLVGAVLTGGYHYAVTGNPLRPAYLMHDEQYAYVGPFWMQPLKPKPAYRQPVIANAFDHDEFRYRQLRTPEGWWYRARQLRQTVESVAPFPLLLPGLFAAIYLLKRERYRHLAWLLLVAAIGLNLTVFHFPHYAAPFLPIWLIFILAGWRMMVKGRWGRAAVLGLLAFAVIHWFSALRVKLRNPAPPHISSLRKVIETHFSQDYDQHLILVTHPAQMLAIEPSWVHNRAVIDEAQVVWAHDLGDQENTPLLAYYPSRLVWRLDVRDPTLTLQPQRTKPGQTPLRFIAPGGRVESRVPRAK